MADSRGVDRGAVRRISSAGCAGAAPTATGTFGWRSVALTVVALMVGAPLGAMVVVSTARSVVAARGGDTRDGIGFVIPALAGAVAAVPLVLLVIAVVLVARRDRSLCVRVARGVVLVPVLATLPVLALLFGGSLLAGVIAVLPVLVVGVVAGAVWRWPQVGPALLVVAVTGAVTVVAAVGLDAVVLLVPHLLLSVGCWTIAAVILAPVVRRRRALPA